MPALIKEGDDDHIKGFILNKLYTMGFFGRVSTGAHNKHTSIDNLPKSYPPKYRGAFPKIIKKMASSAELLIMVFPTSSGEHVCANFEEIGRGLALCNRYRESVRLPQLDRQFKELKIDHPSG